MQKITLLWIQGLQYFNVDDGCDVICIPISFSLVPAKVDGENQRRPSAFFLSRRVMAMHAKKEEKVRHWHHYQSGQMMM